MQENAAKRQEELYNSLPIRGDILSWYPFRRKNSILEIHGAGGIVTEMLCRTFTKVVSYEKDGGLASDNRRRNAQYLNLTVVSGTEWIRDSREKYDYIFLNDMITDAAAYLKEWGIELSEQDILGGAAPQRLVQEVRKLLAPDGIILVSTENRLGMKYFTGAAEPYSGTIYMGLNHYADCKEYHALTHREWVNLGEKEQLKVHFFYPYPEHRYPVEIFTEESISNMGFGKVYHSFERKRLQLYDDTTILRDLVQEGAAHIFANSFLVELSACEEALDRETIYVKLNSDRAEKFRIGTRILRDCKTGEKRVLKYPLSIPAEEHLIQMAEKEARMVLPKAKILTGEKREAGISYAWLTQTSFEEEIRRAILEGNQERVLIVLDILYNKCIGTGQKREYATEAFREVFGNAQTGNMLPCVCPANVDLICDNVFHTEDPVVIDGEWIFDFYVPSQFVLWRAVLDLYNRHSELERLLPAEEVWKHFGIEEEMRKVFGLWNDHFVFQYVQADAMSRDIIPRYPLAVDYITEAFEAGCDLGPFAFEKLLQENRQLRESAVKKVLRKGKHLVQKIK